MKWVCPTVAARAIEELFSKVDRSYGAWDLQTLQSEFYNISTDIPGQANVDPGYLVAQAFWNASDAPVISPPTTKYPNGVTADVVKAYQVLFRRVAPVNEQLEEALCSQSCSVFGALTAFLMAA